MFKDPKPKKDQLEKINQSKGKHKNVSSFESFNTRVTCTHEEEKKTLKLNISKL